jgi:hypothetical protein
MFTIDKPQKEGDEINVVLVREIIHCDPSGTASTRGTPQACNAKVVFLEDEPALPSYAVTGEWRMVPGRLVT